MWAACNVAVGNRNNDAREKIRMLEIERVPNGQLAGERKLGHQK